MRQLIPILALVMLLKPAWPLVEYIVNYDYIVENLCENKDKPMLNCNGKCYLAKKFAQESEEKEKNPFDSKLSKLELPIINSIDQQIISLPFFESTVNQYEWHSRMNSTLYAQDILHPPQSS